MTANENNSVNVVFMAHFNYPHGMAGTKNVQNYIEYLSQSDGFETKVLILRQERDRLADNELCGQYKGVEYVTIGADIRPGLSVLIKGPKYFLDGMRYLKANRRKNHKNVLYVYDYPNTDNFLLILYAKISGYKVVFYIIEDIAHQTNAPDFFAKLKNLSARLFCRMMPMFTDAAMVVSNGLLEKISAVSKGRSPVTMDPVTVDFRHFDSLERTSRESVNVFYGGTFGEKDGVEYLIGGFEQACRKHDNIKLILTGKGDAAQMDKIMALVAASDFRERILYKGYLPDEDYYAEVYDSNILCMTRTSSAYANAGFPYKLGEYLATGVPVIASNVSDISMYLQDKKNAVIIEPDSSTAVADAIEYLLTNRTNAETIGAAGKEVAKQNFDVRVAGKNFKKLLMDL